MTDQNVVPFTGGGALSSPEELAEDLANITRSAPVDPGSTPILKLLKEGRWIYGVDQTDIQPGSEWAINPWSACHGWVAWGEGELLGQVMVPGRQAKPDYASLPPVDNERGWEAQVSYEMECMTGEDTGMRVIWPVSSKGGKDAHRDIRNAIQAQLKVAPELPIPVVALEVGSYNHKKWGKIYTPTLRVTRWLSREGTEGAPAPAVAAPAPARAPVAAAPTPVAAAPAPTPAPQPVQEPAQAAPAPAAQADAPVQRQRRRPVA